MKEAAENIQKSLLHIADKYKNSSYPERGAYAILALRIILLVVTVIAGIYISVKFWNADNALLNEQRRHIWSTWFGGKGVVDIVMELLTIVVFTLVFPFIVEFLKQNKENFQSIARSMY